jgi:hypothetical protein
MQYKTIVLQLLEENPEVYEQLRQQRQVSTTMEHFARELRTLHLAWKETLTQAIPDSDPNQIASEAMERALKDLQDLLPIGTPPDGQEALSLDEAMAFIRRHTSRG